MAAFHRASFAAGVATGVAVALVGRQLAVTAAEYYSEYVDDQDSDDEGEPYKMVLVVRNDLKSAPCQPATTNNPAANYGCCLIHFSSLPTLIKLTPSARYARPQPSPDR